jgi:hypothetical protein
MIRHEYQGCVPCHADPSGAGLLTDYGRAMGENVLRTRYGEKPADVPPVYARFLFGIPTPEWLLLGGSVRNGVQMLRPLGTNPSTGGAYPFTNKFLQMEADLRAQITIERFRASGTLGYMREGAITTQVTSHVNASNCGLVPSTDPTTGATSPACVGNLVSREHWIGVDLGDDKQWLLRAGRLNVPFGIRNDEHDLLVRSTQTTRTNINESQQHGIALSYAGQIVRGEIMAVLGNYQLNPDKYRERGYAGFIELSLKPWAALGVSSLITYADTDYVYATRHTIRQVHGVFTRLAPKDPLVILAEVDALVTTSDYTLNAQGGTVPGMVGMVQADVEPTQGLHLVFTGETMVEGQSGVITKAYGGWAGVLWFFAPHADLRFDFVASSLDTGQPGQSAQTTIYLVPQVHIYL